MPEMSKQGNTATEKGPIAIWLGLSDKKAREKVSALEDLPGCAPIIIFRRAPIPGLSPRFHQQHAPNWLRRFPLTAHLYVAVLSVIVCVIKRPSKCVAVSLLPHFLMARFCAGLLRSKRIIWLIGTDLYRQLPKSPYRQTIRKQVIKCDRVMVMGHNSRRIAEKLGVNPRKLTVCFNAYEIKQIDSCSSELPLPYDVAFCARLDRHHKGLDTLLEVIELNHRRLPDSRFIVLGDGPHRAWFRRQLILRGIERAVDSPGHVLDVTACLKKARVFLMTSNWEGLPAVIVEAMANGLPVVSTKVGDIGEICAHGINALLAPPGSAAQLSEHLFAILTNRSLFESLKRNACETGLNLKTRSRQLSLQAWEEALMQS